MNVSNFRSFFNLFCKNFGNKLGGPTVVFKFTLSSLTTLLVTEGNHEDSPGLLTDKLVFINLYLFAVCKVIINAIDTIKASVGSLVASNTIKKAINILIRVLSIRFTTVGGNFGAAKAAYKPRNTFNAVLI